MRSIFALLVLVAFAAGAALRPATLERLADKLSALEAEKTLEHDAPVSDLTLDDLTADNALDKVERGYDYNPYGYYPYGGYPYGGYGGYPYGGFGGYPYGGYGGYPYGFPFGGGSSSANAVAVSNGGGFFGGSSNANAVAVSGGGGGGGFGRRRRDVDPVDAVESAKQVISEIEHNAVSQAEKEMKIDAVKQTLAETLLADVSRKLEHVQKIKNVIDTERIFFTNSQNVNSVAVATNNALFGGTASATSTGVAVRRRRDADPIQTVEYAKEKIAEIERSPLHQAEKLAKIDAVKQALAETLLSDVADKLESVQKIKQLMQSERILSFVNNQAINAVAVATNNGIFGNANADSTAIGSGFGGRRRREAAKSLEDKLTLEEAIEALDDMKKDSETANEVDSKKTDNIERFGGYPYGGYGGYPYGGYGGYPYGGYGGYPYGGFGGYPYGGFGGYPGGFGGYPGGYGGYPFFGGGSSSANAVAVSSGSGFGGSSNANAVALANGQGR